MKAELSSAAPSKRITGLEASLDAKLHICYFQQLDSQLAFEGSQRFGK
jgi:hypothetical protein